MRSVQAVITAFNPGESLLETANAVAPQVDHVIVVDDGSTDDVETVLDTCRSRGYTVLESPVNRGIAHALNVGIRAAHDAGADAVLTLDQDTVLCEDYVERARAHALLAESLGITQFMLSTERIDGTTAPFWFAHRGLTLAFEPLQSGLVIPRALVDAIGLFDESLFIDGVETEFYLRARAAGAHAFVVPGTDMSHQMGRPVRWDAPRWLGRVSGGRVEGFDFTEHPPFRHYYILRNQIALYRRYGRREPLWTAVSISRSTLLRGRALAFGSNRRERTYFTGAGVRAALRGEEGRLPDATARRAAKAGGHAPPGDAERLSAAAPRPAPSLVSVVIPIRNSRHTIDLQLDGLAAQNYTGDVEVLVCDNGSTDGVAEHLADHPHADKLRLRWIDASQQAGVSFARNVGAENARGELLAFCDADDRVSPQWLSAHVAEALSYDAVGGVVESEGLNAPRVQGWRPLPDASKPYASYKYFQAMIGCNFSVWADVYRKVGGYDTAYLQGHDDTEFSFRLQVAGYAVGFAPDAVVAYRFRDTLRGVWEQAVRYGEADGQLYRDYRPYGMPRRPRWVLIDVVLYLLLRNPLLPEVVTRVPSGRWLFEAGNLVGRIKGSIRHRVFYV